MNAFAALNQKIIEQLLDRNSMTRAEFVQFFKLRPATIYDSINHLKNQGILTEPERKGKRTGRKAPQIELCGEYGLYLGIEVRHDRVILTALNARGEQVKTIEEPLVGLPHSTKIKKSISHLISQIKKESSKTKQPLRALGVADPGLVDVNQGISLKAINIQGWEQVRIQEWIQQEIQVPVDIYPANNARAYREYLSLPFPRPQSLLHVELDYGIGAGFVRESELYSGFNGCGLELGHLVVEENGPYCLCGNRGCLEAVIGKNGLNRQVADLMSQKIHTVLRNAPFSYESLAKALQTHDKASLGILIRIIHSLGIALSSVVTILNPQTIILSGGLTQIGEKMILLLKQQLALHCLPQSLKSLEIMISTLHSDAAAAGAAMLVLRKNLCTPPPN